MEALHNNWLFYLLATANMISLIHLGLFIAGANVYDVLRLRKGSAEPTKYRKKRPYQPLVSIIVPAYNEELGVNRTLDSIRASTYPNIEVIVMDDGSKDRTAELVQQYIDEIPTSSKWTYMARNRNGSLKRRNVESPLTNYDIKLVTQKNTGKGGALNNGIINHSNGSLIMCLDADSLIAPTSVANAVAHFQDRKIIGVAANVRVMGRGWLNTLQRFEHMIGYRSKKFYTITNSEFIVGGVASTYRRSALKRVGYYDTDTLTEDIGLSMKMVAMEGNRDKRIVYASDVVAMTQGVQTYGALIKQRYRWKLGSLQNMYKYREMIGSNHSASKHTRMLTLYRLPVAILGEFLLAMEPLLLSFVLYLSISRQSFGIFLGAYVTITAYTMWTIWPDEYMTVKQKLRTSVSAFGIYILFYAMTLVQLLAIYKCLKNWKQIIHLSEHTTWISPTRVAGPQEVI